MKSTYKNDTRCLQNAWQIGDSFLLIDVGNAFANLPGSSWELHDAWAV